MSLYLRILESIPAPTVALKLKYLFIFHIFVDPRNITMAGLTLYQIHRFFKTFDIKIFCYVGEDRGSTLDDCLNELKTSFQKNCGKKWFKKSATKPGKYDTWPRRDSPDFKTSRSSVSGTAPRYILSHCEYKNRNYRGSTKSLSPHLTLCWRTTTKDSQTMNPITILSPSKQQKTMMWTFYSKVDLRWFPL